MINRPRKKRTFFRQDHHKKKRLAKKWRKPRGCDSKQRLRMQNRVKVSPGYGNPKTLHDTTSGLLKIYVSSLNEIPNVDAKKHTVVLSSKIGLKKKLPIIQELIQKHIAIHNIQDPEEYVKRKTSQLKKRKKIKEEKKEAPKKKKSIEDKLTDEEKKKLEKKEIDKLLTKRQ